MPFTLPHRPGVTFYLPEDTEHPDPAVREAAREAIREHNDAADETAEFLGEIDWASLASRFEECDDSGEGGDE